MNLTRIGPVHQLAFLCPANQNRRESSADQQCQTICQKIGTHKTVKRGLMAVPQSLILHLSHFVSFDCPRIQRGRRLRLRGLQGHFLVSASKTQIRLVANALRSLTHRMMQPFRPQAIYHVYQETSINHITNRMFYSFSGARASGTRTANCSINPLAAEKVPSSLRQILASWIASFR